MKSVSPIRRGLAAPSSLCLAAAFLLSAVAPSLHASLFSVMYDNGAGFTFEGELDTSTSSLRVTKWSSLQVAGGVCKNYLNLNLEGADGKSGTSDDNAITFVARQAGTGLGITSAGQAQANYSLTDEWDATLGQDWFFVSDKPMKDLPWIVPANTNGTVDYKAPLVWGASTSGKVTSSSQFDRIPQVWWDDQGQAQVGMSRDCQGSFVSVPLEPIPEPTAFALVAGASALGLRRRRLSAAA